MSARQRGALLAAAALVLIVAAVVLGGGGDDEPPTATTGASTATTGATTTGAARRREPTIVSVRRGRPVGGVRRIAVRSGEQVRIQVASPDTSDEVHLHGYDIRRDLRAGGSVRFSFRADAEGIFEFELERAGTQIALLKVSP